MTKITAEYEAIATYFHHYFFVSVRFMRLQRKESNMTLNPRQRRLLEAVRQKVTISVEELADRKSTRLNSSHWE